MDGSRFDAWTRRKFGLVTGGGLAALLGMIAAEDAPAKGKGKKKKKKKPCKHVRQGCQVDKKSKKCCPGLTCGESVAIPEGTHCCREAQGACTDAKDCCKPSLCDVAEGRCCILVDEGPCSENEDCCDEAVCDPGTKKCVNDV